MRVMGTKKAMALAIRVKCDKDCDGFGGKCDGNEGGGGAMTLWAMAMVTATTWAMVMATRVASNVEGNGNSGKSNGNGNKGGRQATATRAMVMATATPWVTAMATRLAGNKEGKGQG